MPFQLLRKKIRKCHNDTQNIKAIMSHTAKLSAVLDYIVYYGFEITEKGQQTHRKRVGSFEAFKKGF